jgi:hypothetical protein
MKKSFAGLSVLLMSGLAAGYLIYRQDTQPPSQAAPIPAPPAVTQPVSAVIIPHPRSPRPETLDPKLFTAPETQKAYQIARDKPALLEKMACYCGCMKSVENHTSNLDCFADNHGVGCALCRRIALEANDMQEKGMTVEAIKKEIDTRYAR